MTTTPQPTTPTDIRDHKPNPDSRRHPSPYPDNPKPQGGGLLSFPRAIGTGNLSDDHRQTKTFFSPKPENPDYSIPKPKINPVGRVLIFIGSASMFLVDSFCTSAGVYLYFSQAFDRWPVLSILAALMSGVGMLILLSLCAYTIQHGNNPLAMIERQLIRSKAPGLSGGITRLSGYALMGVVVGGHWADVYSNYYALTMGTAMGKAPSFMAWLLAAIPMTVGYLLVLVESYLVGKAIREQQGRGQPQRKKKRRRNR